MMIEYIPLVLLAVVTTISFMASVSDVLSMRIPNAYCVAIALLFIPAYLLSPHMFFSLWEHITAFALMFIVGYVMFACGIMGGGDSKYAAALSLWVGLKPLMLFMLGMTITGGVLGVIAIYLKKKKPFKFAREGSWIALAQSGRNAVPYGIAITIGFLLSVFHIPMIIN